MMMAMIPSLRGWSIILLGAAVALFFGVAATPAWADCPHKGKENHRHCTGGGGGGGGGGGDPVPADPAIAYSFVSNAFDVMVMDADGSNQTLLVEGRNFIKRPFSPSWSPDGNSLAYSEKSEDRLCIRIIELNADGQWGAPKLLICGAGGPSWHPDNSDGINKIAYIGNNGADDLFVVEFSEDGAGGFVVDEPSTLFTQENILPTEHSWSPDGNKIAFGTQDSNTLEQTLNLLDLTLDPDHPDYRKSLIVLGSPLDDPDASFGAGLSFGKRHNLLAVSTSFFGGDGDIWCINTVNPIDVTNLTDIFDLEQGDQNDTSPSWSPDDREIVFSRNGVAMVFGVDTSSGCEAVDGSLQEIARPNGKASMQDFDWQR